MREIKAWIEIHFLILHSFYNEIGFKILTNLFIYTLKKLTGYKKNLKKTNIKNVCRHTLDGNIFLNTPFFFNEIDLKMLGNVSRFQLYEGGSIIKLPNEEKTFFCIKFSLFLKVVPF